MRGKRIRLMLPEGFPAVTWGAPGSKLGGWAVCSGIPGKPRRKCQWLVVGFHRTDAQAQKAMRELPASEGRAMVNLGYERLQLVAPDGQVRRCAETERKMLS